MERSPHLKPTFDKKHTSASAAESRCTGNGFILLIPLLFAGSGNADAASFAMLFIFSLMMVFLFNYLRSDPGRKIILNIKDGTITFYGKKTAETYFLPLWEVKNIRFRQEKQLEHTGKFKSRSGEDAWICEVVRKDGKVDLIERGADKGYIRYTTELLIEKTGLACEDCTGSGLSTSAIRSYNQMDPAQEGSSGLPSNSAIREKKIGQLYIYSWPKKQETRLNILLLVLDSIFVFLLLFFAFLLSHNVVSVAGGVLLVGITAVMVWVISRWLIVNYFGREVIEIGKKEIRRYTECLGICLKTKHLFCYEIKSVGVTPSNGGGSRLEFTTVDKKTISILEHSPETGLLKNADLQWLARRIQQLLNLQEAKK